MIRVLYSLVILLVLTTFVSSGEVERNFSPKSRISHFAVGEELQYRINFGIFTIGKATTKIHKKIFNIHSKPCYVLEAKGTTNGFASWITKVDDRYGAYIDTSTLLTHFSYQKLREGKYRMDEELTYDHEKNTVKSKILDQKTRSYKKPQLYTFPQGTRDVMSGFLYLRTLDFHKLNPGDTVGMDAFYGDTYYDFKVIYMGKEVINTKLGKIKCVKIEPVMPKNDLFDGKNSIFCWMSDDNNRIPVKMKVKMVVGSFHLDIDNFKGLQHPLKIIFD